MKFVFWLSSLFLGRYHGGLISFILCWIFKYFSTFSIHCTPILINTVKVTAQRMVWWFSLSHIDIVQTIHNLWWAWLSVSQQVFLSVDFPHTRYKINTYFAMIACYVELFLIRTKYNHPEIVVVTKMHHYFKNDMKRKKKSLLGF